MRSAIRPAGLAAALCIALVIAGCGSDKTVTKTVATTSTTPTSAPAGTKCSPGEPRRETVRLGADASQARALANIVRSEFNSAGLCSAVYGVWTGGKPVVTGSIGAAMPGVAASPDMRFRTGNVNEAFETTLLLQYVDQGKVKLDDPISKWLSTIPHASEVTLKMLGNSTSGYADFVANQDFAAQLDANPFRQWTPDEMIAFAMDQPPVFPPGKSWAFSDTNFVLLGQILEKVGGRPLPELMQKMIYDKLGLKNTVESGSAYIGPPVMHSYTNERGPFEDATYWNISWEPGAGDMTSNVDDLGVFARALGEGTLLSPASHSAQLSKDTIGLGPMTPSLYYGLGIALGNGWIFANPQVDGYTGVMAYNPAKRIAIVVSSTMGPSGNINVAYSTAMFLQMAKLLTPGQVPALSVTPRGSKASK